MPKAPLKKTVPAPVSAVSESSSELDCRTCGACCAPERNDPFYVGVTAADLDRMTRVWRDRYVSRDAVLTKLDPVGRCVCVALRGAIGQTVSCSIYARRPEECRRLTAGTKECLAARRQAGLTVPPRKRSAAPSPAER